MRTEGQTETVGDPYRKWWESTLEHILQKSPTLSSQINRDTELPIWKQARCSSEKEVVLSRGKRWYCGPKVCSQLCCWLAKRTWSQWKKPLCPLFPPFEEVSGSIRASHECCAVLHRPWQTAKLSKSSGFFSPVLLLKGPFSEKHSLGCHIVASPIPLHPIIRTRYHWNYRLLWYHSVVTRRQEQLSSITHHSAAPPLVVKNKDLLLPLGFTGSRASWWKSTLSWTYLLRWPSLLWVCIKRDCSPQSILKTFLSFVPLLLYIRNVFLYVYTSRFCA